MILKFFYALPFWKKLILCLCIIQAILWLYIVFYQKAKRKYFEINISKMQEIVTRELLVKLIQNRYEAVVLEQENKVRFVQSTPNEIDAKIQNSLANFELQLLKQETSFKQHQDFVLWEKKIQFKSTYKDLKNILLKIQEKNLWLSKIQVNNSQEQSKEPLLDVDIYFSFITSKL